MCPKSFIQVLSIPFTQFHCFSMQKVHLQRHLESNHGKIVPLSEVKAAIPTSTRRPPAKKPENRPRSNANFNLNALIGSAGNEMRVWSYINSTLFRTTRRWCYARCCVIERTFRWRRQSQRQQTRGTHQEAYGRAGNARRQRTSN